MSDQREAVASLLIEHVKNNDIAKIESMFSHFAEDSQWRDIVRYEFKIAELMTSTLLYDVILPRIQAYEIRTVSPFHYSAFKGHNDILVTFIDHDVPVDVPLTSGTTALHMAAFGGRSLCVDMLIEVYKADVNKQDRYGWSALHYASSEGHIEAVRSLIAGGINIGLRDQDGTSAAFRAQVNGHEDIVDLLCRDEEDLLCVDPAYEGKAPAAPEPGLYSVIKRSNSTPALKGGQAAGGVLRDKPVGKDARAKSEMLPDDRTSTIRRLIRKEFEAAREPDESGTYMQAGDGTDGGQEQDELEKLALKGIGVNTLKGIMREELKKHTQLMFSMSDPAPATETQNNNSNDYDDIYETVRPINPTIQEEEEEEDVPDVAPPLPPRNLDHPGSSSRTLVLPQESAARPADSAPLQLEKMFMTQSSESFVLKESIKRIAPIIGTDWKKLAYALPLEQDALKVQKRVDAIEGRFPGDVQKQAAMSLVEWQMNGRNQVEVDDLVIGLRKCGLDTLIGQVERVTQEFTA